MATEILAPRTAGSIADLSARFDALASRIRRVALVKGLGQLALVTAGLCAVGLLVDWFWPLPAAVRIGWLGVMLVIATYTLYRAVLKPVFRQFTMAELAAIVETQYPELGERLTSSVEFTDPNIPDEHKGSLLMREWLESETLSSTEHIDFRKSVSSEEARKSAWTGGIAVAFLLLPFLLMASAYSSLWARLITPWGNHELPAALFFHVPEGDRVVARGDDVTILALPPDDAALDDLPEAVDLIWTTSAGETNRKAMEYREDQKGFVATLPHVFEGFEYLVSARRKRSERHTITVVDRPEITAFTLKITPPAYTRLPEKTVDGAVGNVEAFERSRIEAVLEFNKPVAKAEWIWRPAEEVLKKAPTALPFELTKDGKSARLELLASNGWFSALAEDEHGLSNIEETARRLTVVTDRPPELALSGQIGATSARKDDVISIQADANDDFAVAALELHLETPNGEIEIQSVPEESLGAREVGHLFALDLAAFDLEDGESIRYRVRAADNRPTPGPQEVWSDERRIIIDPEAALPGSEQVEARQNELREILNAIIKDLRANRQKTEQLAREADTAEADGKPFEKRADLTSLELKQGELADRLEELAARFGERRLFANLTPETQRIAREPITQAAGEFQKARLAKDPRDATESLRKSEESLAKADADLEKISERFDELAELERDLQVVPRLAQQAKRVADGAIDLAKRRDNPPENETPEQKAARETELNREQAALDDERKQLTDALDELLEHRPEILEAAQKSALERIAELSEQAGRLADRQDVLTEALESDANEAAKSAAPLTEQGEELLEKANKLKPAAKNGEPAEDQPKPVNPIDPEELRKVLEELKAGNLEAANKRQAAVADRLETLAAELKKNQELPRDPKEAAEQLAGRQRELVKELAQAAKNAPADDAPAEAKEGFKNRLRNLAEKQTGIQAGVSQIAPPAPNREQQQHALDQAGNAVENLLKSDPQKAADNAKNTAEILEDLAKNIDTIEERKAEARKAVESLRKKQEELGDDVTEAAREKSDEENLKADELAKRQVEIAEALAKLDTPTAEDAQKEAVLESARALSDLDRERLQDAEASQDRAEQALADLGHRLEGKPTAREEVEQLKKRQEEINREAKDVSKGQAEKSFTKQSEAQNKQAERLSQLDAPAAELEKQTAEAASRKAVEELQNPADEQQMQAALDRAAKSLDQLHKALARKPSADPAQAAESLTKRQNQAAESAQKAAKNAKQNQSVLPAEERRRQQEELAQLAEESNRLRAGSEAAEQKEAARDALQKAAEAQKQLEELIKKKQEQSRAGNPNQKPPEPKADDELERLIQKNAEAQKQAAEALEQLKEELAKEDNKEKLHNEMNEAEQLAEKLIEENQPRPEQIPQPANAEVVARLADEARELQKGIEKTQRDRGAEMSEQVAKAEQSERPDPAKPAQTDPSEKPDRIPQDPNTQRPNNSKPNDPSANRSDPNGSRAEDSDLNRSRPEDSDPNGSRAEQSPAPMPMPGGENAPPAPRTENQNPSENTKTAGQNPDENQPGDENAADQNGQQPNPPRAEEESQSLSERQAELARKSAELAVEVARDRGGESEASRQATDAARKASETSQQIQDGALENAAKAAKTSAQAANAAAEELAKFPQKENAAEPSKLAEEATKQSEAQAAIAQELEKAAANPATRQAARQAGEKRLAEASEKLADELNQAARELTSKPLELEKPGEKTQAAGEAAGEAAEEMQQAQANAAKGNAAEAARAGKQASEALRRAAGESPAPPEETPSNTLVPGDLADQVAEARRRLEEARSQLENARREESLPQDSTARNPVKEPMDEPSESSPKTGEERMDGENPGQNSDPMPSQSQPGQNANGQGQAGHPSQGQSGQPGQAQAAQPQAGQPSALAQSAQSLQQAAQSLSQAARQLGAGVPGQNQNGTQGQSANNQNGTPGSPSSSGGDGPGSQSPIPIEELEAELRRQNREVWGQLPGQLKTEILEGNKKKPGGDYARLIKLYSEELLKKQQAE